MFFKQSRVWQDSRPSYILSSLQCLVDKFQDCQMLVTAMNMWHSQFSGWYHHSLALYQPINTLTLPPWLTPFSIFMHQASSAFLLTLINLVTENGVMQMKNTRTTIRRLLTIVDSFTVALWRRMRCPWSWHRSGVLADLSVDVEVLNILHLKQKREYCDNESHGGCVHGVVIKETSPWKLMFGYFILKLLNQSSSTEYCCNFCSHATGG